MFLWNDPVYPRGAVAFTDEALQRMISSAGLRVVRPLLGAWSGLQPSYGATSSRFMAISVVGTSATRRLTARFTPWDGQQLDAPVHAVWARRSHEPVAAWTCEFWLDEARDGRWIYRLDERVTRPLDEIGMERGGVPFLAPEIALLYKSRERSPKSQADLAAVAPQLSESAAFWLHEALEIGDPNHPWLDRLSNTGG